MRTHDIGILETGAEKEFARRVQTVRLKLGYRQEDLAAILGCGQQQISNWERARPIKNFGVAAGRLVLLGEYLSDPVRYQVELGINPEEGCPLLDSPEGNRNLVTDMTADISPGEWDRRYHSLAWAHSNAPLKNSAVLLRGRGGYGEGGPAEEAAEAWFNADEMLPLFPGVGDIPSTEDLVADLKVHGQAFLDFIQKSRCACSRCVERTAAVKGARELLGSLMLRGPWFDLGPDPRPMAEGKLLGPTREEIDDWLHRFPSGGVPLSDWLPPAMRLLWLVFYYIREESGMGASALSDSRIQMQVELAFIAADRYKRWLEEIADTVGDHGDRSAQVIQHAKGVADAPEA